MSDRGEIYKNRQFVSGLILNVLLEKMTVETALLKFPDRSIDINIKCAFDALMHREADEDLRKKVRGYADIQDDYLYYIASTLKENKQLPKNVIAKYLKYHSDYIVSDRHAKGIFEKLKLALKEITRMINF